MVISYWSSLRSSLELGDHKWRLNRNGEIMETNYGDQNFIHHGVENTYLEHFKDRNLFDHVRPFLGGGELVHPFRFLFSMENKVADSK